MREALKIKCHRVVTVGAWRRAWDESRPATFNLYSNGLRVGQDVQLLHANPGQEDPGIDKTGLGYALRQGLNQNDMTAFYDQPGGSGNGLVIDHPGEVVAAHGAAREGFRPVILDGEVDVDADA